MATKSHSQNPFVGPRPFEPREQERFFGREREKAELLSLLTAHRAVLLYAQSGAGKTSLLNAGLIPLLRREGFEVLPVARVRGLLPEYMDLGATPNIYAFNTLMSWIADGADAKLLVASSIADQLKERRPLTDQQGFPIPVVAIFDQFEELFTFYAERWKEREAFLQQVAEALEAIPVLRVLFVIRDDYLACLDPYLHLMPERLRTRYRVERLRKEAASQAIEGPIRAAGLRFEETKKEDEGVAAALCRELLKIRVEGATGEPVEEVGEYVEPVQLQVVCQNLWEGLPPDTEVITSSHLVAFGDVDEALISFYERALKTAGEKTGAKQGELRPWFDSQLITAAATRGTVFRGRRETGGIPNATVEALEQEHIIRAEVRAGSRWYELTHDRLIKPIRKSNEAWQQRVGVPQLQRRVAQLRWGLIGASLLLVAIIAMASYAWLQRNIAVRAIEDALLATKEAVKAKEKAEKAEGVAVIAQGEAVSERSKADKLAQLAFSHELTAAAGGELDRDPERSLLLALHAVSVLDSDSRAADKTVPIETEAALHRALQASRILLSISGHGRGLRALVFSPDGTRLATASDDSTARVWDVASGKELVTLAGHTDYVNDVAYSPDGQRLATASGDKTARMWDAASGKQLLPLAGHTDYVNDVAHSPDGTRLATASGDKTAKVWDASSGKELLTLSGHTGGLFAVTFSPDGQRLATASGDRTAKVWDASSGKELFTLSGHTQEVYGIAFSPDGRRVVTAGRDKSARLWDASSGKQLLNLAGHTDTVNDAAFNPDGTRVATASMDRTAKVWDATSGQELFTLSGHAHQVYAVEFSPDGERLATASMDRTVKVWDVTSPAEMLAFAGHTGGVHGIAISTDGKRLATASADGTAKVFDSASGLELARFTGHTSTVYGIAFSPDGKRLATASRDNSARLWDASSGEELRKFTGHTDYVNDVAHSPDGTRLATASGDKTAKVWDAASGNELFTLSGHTGEVFDIAFSPDGKRLATASRDRSVRIWDAASGKQLAPFPSDSAWVNALAFSPDGTRLATASRSGDAIVRDASSGHPLLTLSGHTAGLLKVAFSPDGKRLATASMDRTARVWDASSAKELFTLPGHTGEVNGIAFSPDGKRLATASSDRTVRVYALDFKDLLVLARRRMTRSLNPAECEKYLHEKVCPAASVALGLVVKGNNLARTGDIEAAIASYRQAQETDPTLLFDADVEARQVAALALVEKGRRLARAAEMSGAVSSFRKARKLNPALSLDPEAEARRLAVASLLEKGGRLARLGQIREALAAYAQAQKIDTHLKVSAGQWNTVCWFGALWEHAAEVTAACDEAVRLAPDNGDIRDSRGLARALLGNTTAAIEDFEAYINYTTNEERKAERQRWIAALRAGRNPFTPEVLKSLRSE